MVGAANVAALPRSADASSAASIGRTRWDALGRILSPNLVHVNCTVLQVNVLTSEEDRWSNEMVLY
jgi:hypothetical protein